MMTTNASTLLERPAQQFPDRIFVIAGDVHLTYRQINDQACRFANVLAQKGIQSGDSIALLMPNTPDFVACYFGVLKQGGIVAPLNITSPAPELAHLLEDSGARLLVTNVALLPVALNALQQAPGCRVLLVSGEANSSPPAPNSEWLETLLAAVEANCCTQAVEQDTAALLLYTSGTTGKPKAAVLTHGNLHSFTPIFARDIMGMDGNSVIMMNAPGSHAIGQVILNAAAFAQCTLSLLPRFDPVSFLNTVQRDRVTDLAMVPSLVQMMLTSPLVSDQSFHPVRTVVIGGSGLAQDVALQFADRFNVRMMMTYAATETLHVTFGDMRQMPQGSVGKLAYSVSLRVVDETGLDLQAGQIGEILVRSPHVFRGYHNMPDQKDIYWLDGWFRTGDMGYLDEQGFLFLVARTKEVIKSSGYSIFPAEVEAVLQAHPAVAMAAITGIPHATLGEIAVAFIVRKPETSVTSQEIIRYCKDRLASYKCPRRVEFREHLPMNSAGKILRQQLPGLL